MKKVVLMPIGLALLSIVNVGCSVNEPSRAIQPGVVYLPSNHVQYYPVERRRYDIEYQTVETEVDTVEQVEQRIEVETVVPAQGQHDQIIEQVPAPETQYRTVEIPQNQIYQPSESRPQQQHRTEVIEDEEED
ncbi:hypothetical protein EC844_11172 [Acinetobacter calcoaceticus]|uniref:Uncharacterized protein n=1 Tax=Acinetobacter calcoaceticus TaxID=471 RepID=A0A4R1XU49_ACICA|nr:hypothetical protein EC844_11172 [Acinetobacter calcoaceticus]